MRKILIVKGTYGYKPEKDMPVMPVNRNSGPIAVEDDEAARLVRLRIATYYDDPDDVKEDSDDPNKKLNQNADPDNHPDSVATRTGEEKEDEHENDRTDGENGAEIKIEPQAKPEYDENTGFDDLKGLLKAIGIPYKVGMSKTDIIAVLEEYYSDEDDGEVPPALGVEDPVK